MNQPLVSIVIATRQRPELLQRAIRSILRQSLQELEILVIDDCSSPDVIDFYRSPASVSDPRLSYHLAAEAPKLVRGVCAARNYGLSLAKAPYVVFFDDDDEMTTPDHLETAVNLHRQFPCCLYFGDIRVVNAGTVTIEARLRPVDAPMTRLQVSSYPPIYNSSLANFSLAFIHRYPHLNATLLDAELARRIGGFAETLIFCEDLNFFLRYADACSTVIYRRQSVVDFDVTPRPRMFDDPNPVYRDLMIVLALSKARATIASPHLQRASRGIEAFILSKAAAKLIDQGNPLAARVLAKQSLSARLTRDGLRQWARSFTS